MTPTNDAPVTVELNKCPPGLFMYNGTLCFKSEYTTTLENPRRYQCDAYVVESGEYFHGGAANSLARGQIQVTPVPAALASAPAGDGGKGLFEALHALERIRDLTPAKANADTARDMHGAVNAIAGAAIDRLSPALARPRAAVGEQSREAIGRLIDPDAWHDTLPQDGCGAYWMGRRIKAYEKADAILALQSPPAKVEG